MDRDEDITLLLLKWRAGDDAAHERVFPLVYDELQRIAHRHMTRERQGHTLDTTTLVHEAYLKLAGQRATWNDRVHFYSIAAEAMRRVLVDCARRYRATKRGSSPERISLTDDMLVADARAETLLALDAALIQLAGIDDRLSRVVECRFVGGRTEQETAKALGVTARTVRRDWLKAKGWLRQTLE